MLCREQSNHHIFQLSETSNKATKPLSLCRGQRRSKTCGTVEQSVPTEGCGSVILWGSACKPSHHHVLYSQFSKFGLLPQFGLR